MSQQGGWGSPGWGGASPPGYGPPPGYTPPPPGGYGGPGGFAPPPPGPTGGGVPGEVVAWEDPNQGFFSRLFGTISGASTGSRAFYARVARSDDPWPAITFSVLVNTMLGLLFGLGLAFFYLFLGGAIAATGGGKSKDVLGLLGVMGAMGLGSAILYPLMMAVMGFVGPWIGGGIAHLMLTVLGGASGSYAKSVRVSGYSAACNLWALVPCVGGFGQLACMAISHTVGLDEAHRCGTGKAAAAVLVPWGVFAACGCALYAALLAATSR